MISPLLFVTCFMFVACLLLIGVIYSRVHWLAKAGLVIASLMFSAMFYRGYVDSLGFPTEVQPSGIFRFVYSVVHEPMQIDRDPGAIFIWIMMEGWRQPRAIALPYTKETRKIIGLAKKRVEGGESVYMEFGRTGDQMPDQGPSNGSSDNQNKSSSGSNTVPYHIHGNEELLFKAPPDTVPKKEQIDHD